VASPAEVVAAIFINGRVSVEPHSLLKKAPKCASVSEPIRHGGNRAVYRRDVKRFRFSDDMDVVAGLDSRRAFTNLVLTEPGECLTDRWSTSARPPRSLEPLYSLLLPGSCLFLRTFLGE